MPLSYLALFVGERVNELVLARLHEAGFDDLRMSHGYVFQHLIVAERSVSQLGELLGVTQQAASKVALELGQLGYLEQAATSDARVRILRLSERGWQAIRKGRALRREIERAALLGVDTKHRTIAHGVLTTMLQRLGGAERVRRRMVQENAAVEARVRARTSAGKEPLSRSRSRR